MVINYPRISNALYRQPWCILPSMHTQLAKVFEAHIANKASGIKVDFTDPEEESQVVPIKPVQANGIAVITLSGVIAKHLSQIEKDCTNSCDLDDFNAALISAVEDPAVAQVLVLINSPGGTVTGVPESAELVSKLSQIKPIIAYTDSMSCSAAYWIMSQCSAAYCSPSADVGSIGVYMATLDETAAMEKAGFKINAIVAEGSPLKLAGASFKALSDEERALFQAGVDKVYTQFVGAIKSKRMISPDALNGWVFDGEQAVEKGLVDGLANCPDEILSTIASL